MAAAARTASRHRLTRLIPILDWSRRYDRRWLRGDVIAGIAVAAMIVPKDLGYAGIAGIPLENGLYAAAAAAIIYGLFCTSRHISTGPSSSLAAVAGGAVIVTGVSSHEAAQLVAAIALATGTVPTGRDPQARLASELPVPRRRDRVPRWCRHRRRDR
jgi:SulP family sulfate permease